jgi:hypothetical protein
MTSRFEGRRSSAVAPRAKAMSVLLGVVGGEPEPEAECGERVEEGVLAMLVLLEVHERDGSRLELEQVGDKKPHVASHGEYSVQDVC